MDYALNRFCVDPDGEDWELPQLALYLENLCARPGFVMSVKDKAEDRDTLRELLIAEAHEFYAEREQLLTGIGVDMAEFERTMLLMAVDRRWMDHIDAMANLRDGIGYRAYAGKDPVVEYQIEAGEMYKELNHLIQEDTVRRLYQARVERTPERVQAAKPVEATTAGQQGPRQPRRVKPSEKVGRNDPCPCGSGKKYKNCCGRDAQ